MRRILKNLFISVLFTLLMSLVSAINIPMSFTPIPITLQLVVCLMAGALHGAVWGAASMVMYICLGMFGLPVFAGMASGAGHVLGPTGGYLIGFIPCTFLCGKLSRFFYKTQGTLFMQFASIFVSLAISTLGLYFFGTLFFSFVTGCGIMKAITLAVLPFIWADFVKIIAATLLIKQGLHFVDTKDSLMPR